MKKFAALALTAALGVAGMGYAKSADARVVIGVGVGLPGVALVAPPVYAPYYAAWPSYYGPGFARFGYGFRGYGFAHGYGYGHGYYGHGSGYGHGRR
jgi:hypothetical protein